MLEGMRDRATDPVRRAAREADLSCPPLPRGSVRAFESFNRLRRRKGSNGFAMSPIEWCDIDAFLRRASVSLTSFEIQLLEELDDLYLAETNKAKPT